MSSVVNIHTDTHRYQEIILHRIRIGICKNLNNFRYNIIGKHPHGLCDTCTVPDNISHFLLTCPNYNTQRRTLMENLKLPQTVTITQLLGEKENYYEIIKYIQNCNVEI